MTKRYFTDTQKQHFVNSLISNFGNLVSRKQILEFSVANSIPTPHFLITDKTIREGKLFNLTYFNTNKMNTNNLVANVVSLRNKKSEDDMGSPIPEKNKHYVPFGFFKDLESIVKTNKFYPVFITGLSGNGKTTMVEQVCAKLERECFRVNISIETDEDDLIGGSTLVNGNIIFREGPVLTAMRRGAILLIDEIDRGSNKLMCLQSILEGKPYFNKKTGDIIHPAEGFNVIATANTKGKGNEDGRFIAAQILDEAFLERFPITVEQEYAPNNIEKKIILNNMESLNIDDTEFAEKLIAWADIIRKTFEEGGVDEIISTRRLVHIVEAYSIFKDKMQAINLCINRFDTDTKNAFLDLFEKMTAPIEQNTTTPTLDTDNSNNA